MLTYTYKCDDCSTMFEAKQRITDDPLETCPDCGENTLKKIITPSGGFRIGGIGVHKPTAHWGG